MQKDEEYKTIAKAELVQGVKALYIPLSAFLACVIMAGGVYLIINGEAFGYFMFALAIVIIISAVFAFLTFQNKLRADGGILDKEDT